MLLRDDGAFVFARRPPVVANRMDDVENVGGGQGIVGAGEMIRRNAENVTARLEMQAARLEAQVEQMFDGLDDVDGAEDVPFDELVGMQGPVFHLVENAFTVSLRFVYLGIGSAATTFYTYSIYVKSLPLNASVSEVEEEFKTFGKIRPNVKVLCFCMGGHQRLEGQKENVVLEYILKPAPETYDHLFDDILLLSDGHIVYQGPRENVLEFFESTGFKCPERKGVADFLQELGLMLLVNLSEVLLVLGYIKKTTSSSTGPVKMKHITTFLSRNLQMHFNRSMLAARLLRHYFLLLLIDQMAAGLFRVVAGVSREMVIANTLGSFVLLVVLSLGGYIMSRVVRYNPYTSGEGSRAKKGMVLPFTPHSITFEDIKYSVDMPLENRWIYRWNNHHIRLSNPGNLLLVFVHRESGQISTLECNGLRVLSIFGMASLPHEVDSKKLESKPLTTIAVELVANPSIIFMDEPTSGLDAESSAIVMRTVRNTLDTGRTVLFLMKRGGEEIYVGPLGRNSCHLIKYFESVNGVPKIRDGYNPATWMLEVTTAAQEETILHRRRLLEQRYWSGLHPSEIISGYTKAIAKAIELLDELVEEGSEIMDVRNKDEVVLRDESLLLLGVHGVPEDFVYEQLKSVMSDMHVDVVKIGMLPSIGVVKLLCNWSSQFKAALVDNHVMVSTSGDILADPSILIAF
ncbi:hypothetical protein IFM89_002299, partial [Coptis chinensis]